MRMMKSMAAAVAISVGALSFAGMAEARDRYDGPRYGGSYWKYKGYRDARPRHKYYKKRYVRRHYYRHRHHRDNDFFPGLAFGLATGAIVGGALAGPRVTYRSSCPAPWTRSWYAYCDAKYVSFVPSTGRYRGYDGRWHTCRCP